MREEGLTRVHHDGIVEALAVSAREYMFARKNTVVLR